MAIVLSHQTALEFWRRYDFHHYSDLRYSRVKSLAHASSRVSELKRSQPFASLVGNLYVSDPFAPFDKMGLTTHPIHLLVSEASQLGDSSRIHAHRCHETLPPRSLVEIGPSIFVVSPELCLVQMAATHDLIDVIALGFEFCSNYRQPLSADNGFVPAFPIMSARALAPYISSLPRTPGKKIASIAAKYIIDNSRSPAETQITMSLTLPGSYGGYGLPQPKLNVRLPIPLEMRSYTTRKTIECDLYWPKARIDVEYNSYAHHSDDVQRGFDNNRAVLFEKMGVKHIAVSRWQSDSREQFEIVVRVLREHLGLRKRKYQPHEEIQHLNLRLHLNDRHI